MRGPIPKPTQQKINEGNPGHRPLNMDEPKPPVSISLEPPEWLDEIGAAEWRRLASELQSQNMLTTWDVMIFGLYCDACSNFVKAIRQTHKEQGLVQKFERTGVKQVSPWYAIRNKAAAEIEKYGKHLGLSPAERSRLSVTAASTDGKSQVEKDFGVKVG